MSTSENSSSRNGSRFRRLWLSDLSAFQAHLRRLDPETLHNRFGSYAPGSFLDDYAETCLRDGSIVYGYFEAEIIRAAGELRWRTGATTAEAALSVESGWRRQGIGTELFGLVIRAACNRRVESLSILCLPHNQAMLDLARKFDAELHFENDEITGRLIAHGLTPLSLWNEYVDDSFGLVDMLFGVQKRLWGLYLHRPGA